MKFAFSEKGIKHEFFLSSSQFTFILAEQGKG